VGERPERIPVQLPGLTPLLSAAIMLSGKSYCTRTVTAKQRGKSIFVCTASFQVPAPHTLSHQYPMPDVPHHSTLPSQEEIMQSMIDNPKVPENYTEFLKRRLEEVSHIPPCITAGFHQKKRDVLLAWTFIHALHARCFVYTSLWRWTSRTLGRAV